MVNTCSKSRRRVATRHIFKLSEFKIIQKGGLHKEWLRSIMATSLFSLLAFVYSVWQIETWLILASRGEERGIVPMTVKRICSSLRKNILAKG
jgi:hypothetical protein